MAEIRTVAVIGAGIAGRRIAYALALAGYHTILEDILPASLRKAEAEMRTVVRRLNQNEAETVLGRLAYASTVEEAARQADLAIEAVPDELESKLEIFILLDKICRPETILASTTSSLSITEIASVTYRPQKCIGMRLAKSQGFEIFRGEQTDEATVTACRELTRKIKPF